jgi:hypothetical protein
MPWPAVSVVLDWDFRVGTQGLGYKVSYLCLNLNY